MSLTEAPGTEVEFTLTQETSGRLDVAVTVYLRKLWADGKIAPEPVPTRSKVATWIQAGLVQLDYEIVQKPAHRVGPDAQITLTVPSISPLEIKADSGVNFEVIFEDQHLLVIDKPAGLVVHPAAGNEQGTLVNGLLHHLGEDIAGTNDIVRPGIVHRLDKGTSGLMVVAKSDTAQQGLISQFLPPRSISRNYLAVAVAVPNSLTHDSGEIELPIGRHQINRKKMAVRLEGGKPAKTQWRVQERLNGAVLLELSLSTGRTHQIRVHLQACDAAIVGDPVYGPGKNQSTVVIHAAGKKLGRQALHACNLAFVHPVEKRMVEFKSELPEDIAGLIMGLR